MADIVTSCADALDQNPMPCKAEAVDLGYPVMLLHLPLAGSITVAGDSPTLAEIQTAIADTGVDKMIVIEEITNGQHTEQSRQTISGADTADGLETVESVIMQITGRIKRFNALTLKDLQTNSFRHDRVKTWVVTSKNYLLGGKYGFTTTNFYGDVIKEGFGVKNYIPFTHSYVYQMNNTTDWTQDDGFAALTNTNYTT